MATRSATKSRQIPVGKRGESGNSRGRPKKRVKLSDFDAAFEGLFTVGAARLCFLGMLGHRYFRRLLRFRFAGFGLSLASSLATWRRFSDLGRCLPLSASLCHRDFLRFRGIDAVTTEGPVTDKKAGGAGYQGIAGARNEHSNAPITQEGQSFLGNRNEIHCVAIRLCCPANLAPA
jgi:hypothetical protein